MTKKKPAKRRPGRPRGPAVTLNKHALEQLETMAGYGLTWGQIAAILGIAKRTLLDRRQDTPAVADAFARGRAKAEAVIGQALYNRAKTGDVPAIRWWEMTRANRRDSVSVTGVARREDPDGEEAGRGYEPIEIRFIDA